jgi:hypothetical protein
MLTVRWPLYLRCAVGTEQNNSEPDPGTWLAAQTCLATAFNSLPNCQRILLGLKENLDPSTPRPIDQKQKKAKKQTTKKKQKT